MKRFSRLVLAELIKTRRSPMLRITWILLGLILIIDLALIKGLPYGQSAKDIQESCRRMVGWLSLTLSFLAPLFVSLIGVAASTTEHRAGGWKHLFCQPQPKWMQMAAKMVVATALLGMVLALAMPSLGLLLRLAALQHPGFSPALPWGTALRTMAWMYLGCISPLILSVWTGVRFSHEGTGILGGIFAVLLSLAGGMALRDHQFVQYFIPWIQPVQTTRIGLRFELGSQGDSPIILVLACITMSILVLGLTLWDLSRFRESE